ncbi:MAG TPA: nicotinate-nucleotide--dimethylbenzimidazole phosphoribosyltransferase [Acidimicrobiales bacterium]|nr:nicotinate-nucleotide--dimethylbenzimidazole phosphoribosyltransferase [Acidimicrobiales bacterium]
MITTILFDIGDTLVKAAAPGTPVSALVGEPLPDVVPTLQALARHHRLGAVTDTAVMTEADVREALGGTGISELLEVVVTSHDIGVAKPDPAGLRLALTALGVDLGDALFVGDADVDEAAAHAAGVAFARVGPERSLRVAVRAALTRRGGAFAAASALVGPVDGAAEAAAWAHQRQLTKPAGSLGRVEGLGAQLAAISGAVPPPVPRPAHVAVFAGDHGVVAQGVTPWPQEVTAQMVAGFVAGGAAINVLARQAGATVTVVDVGVATDLDALGLADAPGLVRRNVRHGTADLSRGPALTADEVLRALDVGAEVAAQLVAAGARALVTGEMGIGNTTPSAAVIAALLDRPAVAVTGRGTGIDDAALQHKVALIDGALARIPSDADPLTVLAEVGGLEIAALAGFVVGGASHRVPVVVDGVIAGAATLVAHRLVPEVLPYVVAGHRSTEPGATAVLEALGLEPVLDLGLRLGEGSGACLALGVLEAAALILQEMATFADAGVTDSTTAAGGPGPETS